MLIEMECAILKIGYRKKPRKYLNYE